MRNAPRFHLGASALDLLNKRPPTALTCQPFEYANNTALIVIKTNAHYVQQKLQSDLNNLYVWFVGNNLSVNADKSYSVLFTSNRSKHKDNELQLTICDKSISHIKEVKYIYVCILILT